MLSPILFPLLTLNYFDFRNASTTNTISVSVTRSSPAPARSSPALSSSGSTSLPLPPTLPPANHTSPFSSHPGPPPPPLLPVAASHHSMFPPGPLTPTLPMEATAGPSPYRAETLFTQPSEYKKRELEWTRVCFFLFSLLHAFEVAFSLKKKIICLAYL